MGAKTNHLLLYILLSTPLLPLLHHPWSSPPPCSGLLLRSVPALRVLGPGVVQPGVLPDPAGPPGHAPRRPAVPAGVAGGHADGPGHMPHGLRPGLQLVGVRRGR